MDSKNLLGRIHNVIIGEGSAQRVDGEKNFTLFAPSNRSMFLSVLGACEHTNTHTHLCYHFPLSRTVLAGVDAVVPAPLQHVQDWLSRHVELGGPAYLQHAGRHLLKHQLLPGLQRSTWSKKSNQ